MNRLYNLAGLVLFFGTSFGQDIDSITQKTPFQQEMSIDKQLVVLGNGSIVTSFLHNSLVRENHWTDEIVQNQINALSNQNRFGAQTAFDVKYHTGDGTYFGAGYQNIIGGIAQKSIFQLVLEGNQNQPNITLDQNNGFEQIGFAYLSFGKAFKDTAAQRKTSFGVSLYGRQNYSKYTASSGTFDLDSAGESIQVNNADIAISQDISDPFNTFGLGASFKIDQIINENLISFEIQNLGVFFGSKTRSAQMLSAYSFDGFNLSSQINNAGSVRLQDSINNNYFTTDTSSAVQLLPFSTSVAVNKPLGNRNNFRAELHYVYFTGYYPLLKAEYHQHFKGKSASWNVGARVGGFGNYAISLGTHIPLSKHTLTAQIAGLESMISENLPVNWYAQVGLKVML